MSYTLQAFKTDTIASVGGITSGSTSMTLTTGAFGSPTGTQVITLDYNDTTKKEIITCTIVGTAITSMVRGVDGTTAQAHSQNAPVTMTFTPTHYDRVANRTLGYAQVTANQAAITTPVDLSGLSVTVTVPTGGARIRITGFVGSWSAGENADKFTLSINEGATQLAANANQNVTSTLSTGLPPVFAVFVATAGSHTYKLRAAANGTSPSLTMEASATLPAFILVENIE